MAFLANLWSNDQNLYVGKINFFQKYCVINNNIDTKYYLN